MKTLTFYSGLLDFKYYLSLTFTSTSGLFQEIFFFHTSQMKNCKEQEILFKSLSNFFVYNFLKHKTTKILIVPKVHGF
jgi:hypothetical protein